jgi:hypothetical protein
MPKKPDRVPEVNKGIFDVSSLKSEYVKHLRGVKERLARVQQDYVVRTNKTIDEYMES